MRQVTPKIFFLGQMELNHDGVESWLHHVGGEEAVRCLDNTRGSDLEILIELLARRCYKSFAPGLNANVTKVRTDSAEYHANIAKQRHGSVTAHGHFTYAFEDVSRVFTHELVRNVQGNDISQESLRYVRSDDLGFWVPSIIANSTATHPVTGQKAIEIMLNHVIDSERRYKQLCDVFDIDNMKDFATKKVLTSAFRRIAPQGMATGIGMTFNIRSMRWLLEQRTDPAAEEEMRLVAGLVAEDVMTRFPMMFQDFEKIDTGDSLHQYKPQYSKI